jgi:hypothetical protein
MASQEDEENYWPGYVDALTTMTMVLTFIMLVLGLAVFSLSQNVSKGMLESIAKAMKLPEDLPQDISADEITRILIERVEKQDAAMLAAQAAVAALAADRDAAARRTGPDANAPRAQAAGSGDAPGSSPVERRIETQTEAASSETAAPVSLTTGQAQFRLIYKPRATGLDEIAKGALAQAMAPDGPMRAAGLIEIVAGVDAASPAVSDGNRVAYYRALIVRSQLMSAGMEPERIKVRVDGRLPGEQILISTTPKAATNP